MTEVTVRSLGEEDWREFKAIRLAALRDSPDAFAASADEEEGFEEDFWRLRVRRSTRLVAVRLDSDSQAEGQAVGVVSLGQGKDEEGRVAEIFGLWVAPDARGTGVATKLVEASAERARRLRHQLDAVVLDHERRGSHRAGHPQKCPPIALHDCLQIALIICLSRGCRIRP